MQFADLAGGQFPASLRIDHAALVPVDRHAERFLLADRQCDPKRMGAVRRITLGHAIHRDLVREQIAVGIAEARKVGNV